MEASNWLLSGTRHMIEGGDRMKLKYQVQLINIDYDPDGFNTFETLDKAREWGEANKSPYYEILDTETGEVIESHVECDCRGYDILEDEND